MESPPPLTGVDGDAAALPLTPLVVPPAPATAPAVPPASDDDEAGLAPTCLAGERSRFTLVAEEAAALEAEAVARASASALRSLAARSRSFLIRVACRAIETATSSDGGAAAADGDGAEEAESMCGGKAEGEPDRGGKNIAGEEASTGEGGARGGRAADEKGEFVLKCERDGSDIDVGIRMMDGDRAAAAAVESISSSCEMVRCLALLRLPLPLILPPLEADALLLLLLLILSPAGLGSPRSAGTDIPTKEDGPPTMAAAEATELDPAAALVTRAAAVGELARGADAEEEEEGELERLRRRGAGDAK